MRPRPIVEFLSEVTAEYSIALFGGSRRLRAGSFVEMVECEERTDIDHRYMTAVQMMSGQGGWPMTVFLTPHGKPFYGGTYYPPDDRYGRPGFPRLLMAIEEAWTNRRAEVEQQVAALV